MDLFKRKIKAKTCFLMGVVSGALYLVAALLALFGQGAANFIQISAFAFEGAMLLFLATVETGAAGKGKRLRLLGIFVLLILSLSGLPPFSTLAGGLVMPLLVLLYLHEGRLPVALGLLALELVYVGVDLYVQVGIYNQQLAGSMALLYYLTWAVVGLAQGLAAFLLFRQERDKRVDPGEGVRPSYK